jgi:ABC-2 type transport system permease protein
VTGPSAMTGMTDMAAVRMVAGREITTRLASRAWRITTLVFVIIVIALCVVLKLISSSGTSTPTVGYLPQTAAQAAPLRALSIQAGTPVDTRAVRSQQAGEQLLKSGDLDALLVGNGASVQVLVQKNVDPTTSSLANLLAGRIALDQQITALHGDPGRVAAAQASAHATVTPVQAPYPYQVQNLVLGIVAGVLIYMSLMINGQTVAQGVVEEKSSRVVELLLATIRPWQLMAGKVLGIGLTGLLQMLVIGVVGLVAGLSTGLLSISVTAAVSTVVWLIVWFVLGFFMYAIVFAGLGALVSRQEDVGGVVAPALIFVIAGYVLGVSILPSNPGSGLVEVLSVIPVFAPTLMPMRLAMGGVPAWEAALSVVLVLALIPGLVWLAARIYRNAVLRTGARVKLSQALRAA